MNVIFIFQDVFEIVNGGVPSLEANSYDVQKATHKDHRKKYGKALLLIHKCEDPNVFEKIIKE